MADTAALLGSLLATNSDINYYTQQQIFWSNKYTDNQKKLNEQVKYEQKWEEAYDDAYYTDKEEKDGKEFKASGPKGSYEFDVAEVKDNATNAKLYADAKVYQYDEQLSIELADLDMEYDTMKTMYETLLETLRAQQDAEKTATSTAAADTGLLGGGS